VNELLRILSADLHEPRGAVRQRRPERQPLDRCRAGSQAVDVGRAASSSRPQPCLPPGEAEYSATSLPLERTESSRIDFPCL